MTRSETDQHHTDIASICHETFKISSRCGFGGCNPEELRKDITSLALKLNCLAAIVALLIPSPDQPMLDHPMVLACSCGAYTRCNLKHEPGRPVELRPCSQCHRTLSQNNRITIHDGEAQR